jgi:glycosyltransferase involved in cell wall biosynthesis
MMSGIPKILIVGTISNASRKFTKDMRKIDRVFTKLASVHYYFVESDSSDNTLDTLAKFESEYNQFSYISMGSLRQEIPNRIERIRYCRNVYVEYIRNNHFESRWDYIVVADLDGMNSRISTKGIHNSLGKMKSWDGLFANQLFGYYDIYALRCKNWVEENLIETVRKLNLPQLDNQYDLIQYFRGQRIRQKILYSKMKVITRGEAVINVQSAFGGLGIYKPSVFTRFDYSREGETLFDECEHITLHNKCIADGCSLGINPRMINSWLNEYNLNKVIFVRVLRDVKRMTMKQKSRGTK